jgi:hypothetical protein
VYIAKNVEYYWKVDHADVFTLLILFPVFTALSWIRTCVRNSIAFLNPPWWLTIDV